MVRSGKFSLIFFIIGCSVVFYTMSYGLLPGTGEEDKFLRNLSYSCLAFSFLFGLLEKKYRNFQPKYKVWLFVIIGYFLFLAAYGIFRGNSINYFRYDIAIFTFLSALLVGSDRSNWKPLDKMLTFHFIIGLIVYIYALGASTLSFQRDIAVSSIAYKVQPLLYPWPYLLLTFTKKSASMKILIFLGSILILANIIIFQKREPLGSFIFIILSFLYLNYIVVRKKANVFELSKNVTKAAVVCVVLFAALGCFYQVAGPNNLIVASSEGLYERIFSDQGRFMKANEAISFRRYELDPRYLEAKYFFDQATSTDFLIGQGFGGLFYTPIIGDTTFHIGYVQLILKGGYLFIILWVSGFLMLITNFITVKKRTLYCFYYFLPIQYLLFLPFEPALNIIPAFGLLLLCSGAAMSQWLREEIYHGEVEITYKITNRKRR